MTVTTDDLQADLDDVADKLGRPPSSGEYDTHGSHASSMLRREWGSWHDALEAAGYDPDNAGLPAMEVNLRKIRSDSGGHQYTTEGGDA